MRFVKYILLLAMVFYLASCKRGAQTIVEDIESTNEIEQEYPSGVCVAEIC